MISRRQCLVGGVGAVSIGIAPGWACAGEAAPGRFIFIMQRGAADGLSMIAPVGDPQFRAQRAALAEGFADAPRLDPFFALHPRLVNIARLYRANQVLPVHAVASRSPSGLHFEAQNILETGGSEAYRHDDTWLARLQADLSPGSSLGLVTASGVGIGAHAKIDLASCALPVSSAVPLARGCEAGADRRVAAAYGNPSEIGLRVAARMAAQDRPPLALIETGGWDTHTDQSARLDVALDSLDRLISGIEAGLGPLWNDTTVLIATEFGRSVRPNCSGGTEHGAGSAAILLGGSVRGGRVVADWPGLADGALSDGGALRPTLAIESLIGGAVAAQFGITPVRAMRLVCPGAEASAVEI